uniref:Uncharacterized protein n=1 Tax=Rhodococcus hoagii TaxID=43767 RepID=A0A0F7IDC7_RHOHA|nr:hypothetical protein pVAPN_1300 [Prescottella equi]
MAATSGCASASSHAVNASTAAADTAAAISAVRARWAAARCGRSEARADNTTFPSCRLGPVHALTRMRIGGAAPDGDTNRYVYQGGRRM